MERYSDYASSYCRYDVSELCSCTLGSSPENNDPINNNSNNNAANFGKGNNVMDLKWISSRIIHSDNITRQNLNREESISIATPTADDDEQFFHKIKSEIDQNHSPYSKEHRKSHMYCRNNALAIKKKRPIIDAETQNVMKRFKRDSEQINFVEPLNNASIVQSNTNNNILKETCNTSTNIHKENIMQRKNLFSASISNRRIPSSKYIFQVTSKLQTNVLPSATSEAAIVHEAYEESLFCGTILLTPPDSNSTENDDDS